MEEAARVPAPNVCVRYVVAALSHAKPYALNMQLGIAKGNIDEQCSIACVLGPTHQGESTMTGQCAL